MSKILQVEQVAQLLGFGKNWVYQRTKPTCPVQDRIPHMKIGGKLRFDEDKVIAWLHDHAVANSGDGSGQTAA